MTSDETPGDRAPAAPAQAAPAPADRAGADRARTAAALAVPPVVLAGLATARYGTGAVGDALGDALYAVLVLLVVTVVLPRLSVATRAGLALGLCWVVELAQLTGGPAAAVAAWPPLQYLLGTTFAWPDLLAYAAGAGVAAAVMVLSSPRSGGPGRPALRRP
ncbi:DUF2809 domain-containing protein [Cellulomonas hominis]|uniref:DUF2809 domain-containing protein n=1 Tax=Cellulomonas hominis TaxID=156981 RepID=UPI001C0F4692|nr:DUF2809 domain-containing protein [Cellulomonas hominis]MBU5422219.1 DUF2809 domain-containing protein [Cellulomonas hominis]